MNQTFLTIIIVLSMQIAAIGQIISDKAINDGFEPRIRYDIYKVAPGLVDSNHTIRV